jgi:hypothetical protein
MDLSVNMFDDESDACSFSLELIDELLDNVSFSSGCSGNFGPILEDLGWCGVPTPSEILFEGEVPVVGREEVLELGVQPESISLPLTDSLNFSYIDFYDFSCQLIDFPRTDVLLTLQLYLKFNFLFGFIRDELVGVLPNFSDDVQRNIVLCLRIFCCQLGWFHIVDRGLYLDSYGPVINSACLSLILRIPDLYTSPINISYSGDFGGDVYEVSERLFNFLR